MQHIDRLSGYLTRSCAWPADILRERVLAESLSASVTILGRSRRSTADLLGACGVAHVGIVLFPLTTVRTHEFQLWSDGETETNFPVRPQEMSASRFCTPVDTSPLTASVSQTDIPRTKSHKSRVPTYCI